MPFRWALAVRGKDEPQFWDQVGTKHQGALAGPLAVKLLILLSPSPHSLGVNTADIARVLPSWRGIVRR
jgi:hypothetical protein